jgi:hypothetical protein
MTSFNADMDSFEVGVEDGIKLAGLRRTQRLAKARLKAHAKYQEAAPRIGKLKVGEKATAADYAAYRKLRDSKARLIRAARKMDRRARRYPGGPGAYEHTMDFSHSGGRGTPIDASELIGRMKPRGPQGIPKTRASYPIWRHMLRTDQL